MNQGRSGSCAGPAHVCRPGEYARAAVGQKGNDCLERVRSFQDGTVRFTRRIVPDAPPG